MELNKIHKVYFLGIGGIGMSALARFFKNIGKEVAGYDKTPTELTERLIAEGISITFEDSLDTMMINPDLLVFTPAIPKNHLQLNEYKDKGFRLYKRAEVLGLIANSMFNISIGGSHGKTSTSSITAHIFKNSGEDVAAFLGGIAVNYQSNFLQGNKYAIAEADEFDRSFLQLNPNILLLTSIDTDHLDIYGSFENILASFKLFTHNLRPNGKLILNSRVDKSVVHPNQSVFYYSLDDEKADFYGHNIKIENGAYIFDVKTPNGLWTNLVSNYGGRHNIENAVGALSIAFFAGIKEEKIRTAIESFKGVKRRFEVHIKRDNKVYIDDYAHHPREIDATLSAVKELYPNKKITACFQPHLFSRTNDLYKEFGESLSKIDQVILLDIYPARELPMEGVTSQLIFDCIVGADKYLITKSQLLPLLENLNTEVFVTIGAGDIDTMIQPIIDLFKA